MADIAKLVEELSKLTVMEAAELAKALGGLKGPIMKAAQLLSTIPEALPPEYARELAQLQFLKDPEASWRSFRHGRNHWRRS